MSKHVEIIKDTIRLLKSSLGLLNKIMAYTKEELEGVINPNLLIKIDDLELSVRAMNACKDLNIVYVGDLVQLSENEFGRLPRIGRKTVNEIKEILTKLGVSFGMIISFWNEIDKEAIIKLLKEKK